MPQTLTFEALFSKWPWRPIPNCPGRFNLSTPRYLTLKELTESDTESLEFRTPNARDTVVVTPLNDGAGLISYRSDYGACVHTLNNREGFERKLSQLGISLPPTVD